VDELDLLRNIERLIKRSLPKEMLDSFEVDPQIRAEPIPNGRSGSKQPQRGRRNEPDYPPAKSSSSPSHQSKKVIPRENIKENIPKTGNHITNPVTHPIPKQVISRRRGS
jgi:ATP-dependent RNA helicase RhlE